jgi:hypothetical protein
MHVKVQQESDLVQAFIFFVQTSTQELCSEGEALEKLNVSKKKDQQ